MTPDQKRHFGELRARGGADVADYSDEVRYMPFLIEVGNSRMLLRLGLQVYFCILES